MQPVQVACSLEWSARPPTQAAAASSALHRLVRSLSPAVQKRVFLYRLAASAASEPTSGSKVFQHQRWITTKDQTEIPDMGCCAEAYLFLRALQTGPTLLLGIVGKEAQGASEPES